MRSANVVLVVTAAVGVAYSLPAFAQAPPPHPGAPAAAPPGYAPPPGGYAPPPPGYYPPPGYGPPPAADGPRTANNALYVELLGAGFFYSLNYDRSFGPIAARVGFGYIGISGRAADGSTASVAFVTVPVGLTYTGIGSKKHMFEIGAGATIIHVGAGVTSFGLEGKNESATGAIFYPTLGYRLQPPDGGFFLRTGVDVLTGSGVFLPWPYVGLGGTF